MNISFSLEEQLALQQCDSKVAARGKGLCLTLGAQSGKYMDFSAWVGKAASRGSAQILLAGHSHVQSGVISVLL